jgi:hypothetical protein
MSFTMYPFQDTSTRRQESTVHWAPSKSHDSTLSSHGKLQNHLLLLSSFLGWILEKDQPTSNPHQGFWAKRSSSLRTGDVWGVQSVKLLTWICDILNRWSDIWQLPVHPQQELHTALCGWYGAKTSDHDYDMRRKSELDHIKHKVSGPGSWKHLIRWSLIVFEQPPQKWNTTWTKQRTTNTQSCICQLIFTFLWGCRDHLFLGIKLLSQSSTATRMTLKHFDVSKTTSTSPSSACYHNITMFVCWWTQLRVILSFVHEGTNYYQMWLDSWQQKEGGYVRSQGFLPVSTWSRESHLLHLHPPSTNGLDLRVLWSISSAWQASSNWNHYP